ncbi:IS701 family transposase (plasmid) [Streptomyces poriferorum]|uniref:IS701 family transposase n=1 Tax=Streptomyces poriferorum TaxID=2798799 RepID=UPI00273D1DA9|nr:IS701 family transposase [Streptomyces sp. Alt1]WLQ51074.1 IS701 family transposase [Streptomyces sp. Alt1]WLQ53658.1 IS701 family transposase [Streptomyces sp. Alt1]
MRADELGSCRGRLEAFAGEVFAPLARADQRVKGGLYLRGLLLDGRRKSMQPMAGRLGVDHQQLQQFMTSSTWPVNEVRARLARRAVAVVRPQVWVVDDTGFPKDGTSSPGVARQYSGTLGKVGNCQIGVSVHAASDTASCPLSWRLFLPGSWDQPEAADRRARCRIPESEHHRPKWQLALDMLDELAALGLRPAVLVADTGYGANADFRHGLEGRGLAYALQVKSEMTAHAETAEPYEPPYSGLGPRPLPRYRTRPISLREHVLAAGRNKAVAVTWRKGSKAAMSARFVFLRVRLAGRRPKPAPDGVIGLRWLIAQWPEGENEPVKYWISNLPADIPARDLVRLAKLRWRIEHDYRELKTTLGLDHFEGRSFTGWHRHVTLVTAAHLFLTEQRSCPKVPARA